MSESLTECSVSIPYQELWWFLVREGISQLLGGPFRSGMINHVEVNDLSSVMGEEDQHMKQLEGNGRYG